MLQVRDEVERLLDKIRVAAQHNPAVERASDQISVLCRGQFIAVLAGIGEECGLSPSEERIAQALFSHPSRVMRRESLMDSLYFDKPDDGADRKIIDVYICKLRKKLPASKYKIENIHGIGYRGIILTSAPNSN